MCSRRLVGVVGGRIALHHRGTGVAQQELDIYLAAVSSYAPSSEEVRELARIHVANTC